MTSFLKKIVLLVIPVVMLFSAALPADAYVSVRGYTRKDGTYVRPHVRSEPNGLKYDNYSWKPSQGLYNQSYGTRGSSWNTPTWVTDPDYYVGKRLYEQGGTGSYAFPSYRAPVYTPPVFTIPTYGYGGTGYSPTPSHVFPNTPSYTKPAFPKPSVPMVPSYTIPIAPSQPSPPPPSYSVPVSIPSYMPSTTPYAYGTVQAFDLGGPAHAVSENDVLKRISNEQVELFDKLDSCSRAPSNWVRFCSSWKNRSNNFDFLIVGSNDADQAVLERYFPKLKLIPSAADKPIIPSFGGDCPAGYIKISSGNCRAE